MVKIVPLLLVATAAVTAATAPTAPSLPLNVSDGYSANYSANHGDTNTWESYQHNSSSSMGNSGPFVQFKMLGKSRVGRSVCKISEFGCRTGGGCIPSDKLCDGVEHCGDGSDEPRFCTPCNRTYYGEWGQTYSISLSSATIAAALGLSHEQQILLQGDSPTQPKASAAAPNIKTKQKVKVGESSSSGSMRKPSFPQFLCVLTLAAAGENFGDIVQVMFDSVNIGHFTSPVNDGCPDGSLQVAEINRPLTPGKWCGSGSGYSVYFSETSAIALTLGLNYVPINGGGGGGGGGGPQKFSILPNSSSTMGRRMKGTGDDGTMTMTTKASDDFEFKIRYKFIPRSLASVRFGSHGSPTERGEVVPGSYCSRDFEYCHRRRCKIQSPNYPGLYPRGVVCLYTIRHREKQPCKHVLIQVGQSKSHKIQFKNNNAKTPQIITGLGSPVPPNLHLMMQEDAVISWEECGQRDSITVHDGVSQDDPVLLVICGGSLVPPVTSSGSELLVVFRAMPYGNPLEPRAAGGTGGGALPLRGFELDVDIIMVDSESAEYSNFKDNCTFFVRLDGYPLMGRQEKGGNWISGRRGMVSSPRHTITPNTTCRYEFKGTRHEVVWVYFVAYSRAPSRDPKSMVESCTSKLTIRDGIDVKNEVLIGSYCEPELPKLCDHKALENDSRVVRSCSDAESYISAGSSMIIEQGFFEGTALRPISYQFHYEFVSRAPHPEGSCNRVYHLSKMTPKGFLSTTDNVFDFGRGGSSNVSCTYTFHLPPNDALRLSIRNASFGERACSTLPDWETGRSLCIYPQNNTHYSELRVLEYVWAPHNSNVTGRVHCLCSNQSGAPSLTFLGRRVELTFRIEGMTSRDSFENFFVQFDYEVLKGAGCKGDNHWMRTESGIISLESSYGTRPMDCEAYPWLLEARENHSLYLRIPGYPMMLVGSGASGTAASYITANFFNESSSQIYNTSSIPENYTSTVNEAETKFPDRGCLTTKNRILIYDSDHRLLQKICPASIANLNKKSAAQIVEIYSEDFGKYHSPLFPPKKPRFLIEFVGKEYGSYQIKWLEILSGKMKTTMKAMDYDGRESISSNVSTFPETEQDKLRRKPSWEETLNKLFEGQDNVDGGEVVVGLPPHLSSICPTYCPELKGCISPKLWCDGEVHCPSSGLDEAQCDNFWATLNQLLSPAVYVPLAAAALSALCCCGLVVLCVTVKRMVVNMRDKGQLGTTSGSSSRASTVDRRLPQRDYFYDPHYPNS